MIKFFSFHPFDVLYLFYVQDAAFTTEVYHVNGEGRDGGVVYTEMQGVENTGERKVNRELMRAMYPGDCGYKSVTGGIMHNLRTSTTNEKVFVIQSYNDFLCNFNPLISFYVGCRIIQCSIW